MLRALIIAGAGLCLSSVSTSTADLAAAEATTPDEVPIVDDGVCDPSDVECALSLRQLRAKPLSPDGNLPSQPDAEDAEDVAAPTSLVETLHKKKNVKKLYHLTSPLICGLIKKGGFKPGHNGWCGAAIYFAASYRSVWTKAVGVNSHTGCLLEVKVDVGKVKTMPPTCDLHMTRTKLYATNHTSIKFNPGDGIEYVIFDPRRVLSVKEVWHDPKLSADADSLAPVRVDANGVPIHHQLAEEGDAREEALEAEQEGSS